MLKTKLKPYVHKVKGAKNYGLYDVLNGNFYTLDPNQGDVETLKKSLKAAGLTIETRGTVPFSFTFNMMGSRTVLKIRELQVRLNGRREKDCLQREIIDEKKRYISPEILTQLQKELDGIPVKTLRIEAETLEPRKTIRLLKEYPFEKAILSIKNGLTPGFIAHAQTICNGRNAQLIAMKNVARMKEVKELDINSHDFFYRRFFNPCLGQQVAIDCDGEIKPCLWWEKPLAIISGQSLKGLINSGAFDDYWELTKNRIPACNQCERKFACNDCRVSVQKDLDKKTSPGKPSFCTYEPLTGGEE